MQTVEKKSWCFRKMTLVAGGVRVMKEEKEEKVKAN